MKLYFLANSLLASVALLHAQKVNVWLTTDDQKTLLQSQQSVSFSNGGSVATPTVFVDEQERDQSIEGFGASFTDSSAWLMKEIIAPASSLPTVMNSLFDHAAGIGISFVRNPMGAADLARTVYSYDDLSAGATDPNLTSFSIAHDTVDIIPLLLQAKQINPQLRIMATPWSPPGWMKTSGSMIDGACRRHPAPRGLHSLCELLRPLPAGLRRRRGKRGLHQLAERTALRPHWLSRHVHARDNAAQRSERLCSPRADHEQSNGESADL